MATEVSGSTIITSSPITSRLDSRAALIDVSDRGRLLVSGVDAIDLLNRLSTNDLERLQPGHGMGTVLTTNKGRIIDLLRVLRRAADLLVLTSPGTQGRVAEWIDFYTFAEDVQVTDLTPDTRQHLVVGGTSADALQNAGYPVGELAEELNHAGDGGEQTVIRATFGELSAFELITPTGDATPDLKLLPIDESEFTRLRVEQGVAAYPSEMNEGRNPLEANLTPHINFNKGCYIGQEVVARLNTYDRVQRFLCQLLVDDGSTVDTGSPVLVDGREVGEVTSSAPGLALAFLRKRSYQDGAQVEVSAGGEPVSATVRDIRPSYE